MGNKAAPTQVGLGWDSKTVIGDMLFQMSGDYGLAMTMSWRCTDWLTWGWTKTWKSATNPMGDVSWQTAFVGTYDNSKLQYGINIGGSSPTLADTKVNDATLYFNHSSDKFLKNSTVGSEMRYDVPTKKFNTKVGLQLE